MSKKYWIAGILAVGVGAGALGMAQAKQGNFGPWAKAGSIFAEFDMNNDGKVTKDEIEQSKKARFAAADTNGDVKISSDEAATYITAEIAKRVSDRAARFINNNDADGDGMLSYDEMGMWEKQDKMFSRIDVDGDGVVTKKEFAAAAVHKRWHRNGRQRTE